MEKLLEEYDKMEPLIFPTIEERFASINQKGQSEISKIVSICRRSFYEMYAFTLAQKEKPTEDQSEIIKSSILEVKDILEVVNPINVQSFTSFISEAYANPPQLAQALAKSINSSYSMHLINLTIPSIFGFFTTKEQSAQASSFYTVLSSLLPYDLFCNSVSPFFVNSCLESFNDNFVGSFFFANYLKPFNARRFSDFIINTFKEKIRFIPQAQFSLIRFLSLQWSSTKLWKFLVRSLIIPTISIHYYSSPFAHARLVQFNIDELCEELRKSEKFPALDLTVSWPFEMPGDFIFTNGVSMFKVVFTKKDIESMLSFQESVKYHGASLSEILSDVNADNYEPFSITFYPKIPIPPQFPMRSLFFNEEVIEPPNDNQNAQLWNSISDAAEAIRKTPIEVIRKRIRTTNALLDEKLATMDTNRILEYGLTDELSKLTYSAEIFEQLLAHKMHERKLRDFLSLSSDFEQKTALIYSTKLNKNKKQKFWQRIEKTQGSSYVKFFAALQFISSTEQQFIKPVKAKLERMEETFQNIIFIKQKKIGASTINQNLQQRIMENNMLLSFVNKDSSFIDRAVVLFSYLKSVEYFCNIASMDDSREQFDSMIHFAIAVNNVQWILRTSLIIDGCLFTDPRFSSYIGNMYSEVWAKFKATLIQFMAGHESILMDFITMTDDSTFKVQE